MGYKFRLCFQLRKDCSFTGDEESVEFLTRNGESLTLVATDKEKKLGSSKRFVLGSRAYNTVEEATKAGEAARVALLYYAITDRVGIDFGKYEPAGGLTKAGKEMFSAQLGAPVLNDRLGLTVFEAESNPRFIRIPATFSVGKSTQAFVDTVSDAYRRYVLVSPRAEVAIELFTISYFESTPSARFLSLYMSLETLLEPLPRSAEAQEHVNALIEITRSAKVPEEDKQSLLGALGWLNKESIAQTGRKVADKLLGGNLYDSLPPGQFFAKIYRMRNDLVHRGVADRNELARVVGELGRFVGDILRHQFNET